MSLSDAMNISVSGVEAERRVLELIASNLANINTTRTASGGPYRRLEAVISERPFVDELAKAEGRLAERGGGVEVTDVVEDPSPFQRVYRPGHPDADAQGFVSLPNVDLSKEMVDLVYVSRLYEANITVFNALKKSQQDLMQLQ
ncbi:flagellar basal body rod protein FlgC [Candidatus Saganbacteria bacterium CG08_land_8_20_14_0_20_45_16]|uniref:Flagellar basal-body rod protein FlgC n=1 Tax=Candidatus Saganbacteria bacterium CG08_land_8_20_14_0_20_45_16 TaxID=2014293 RepID=A0A2H0Y0L6_UNCSA|nr:MAG: flagellar basal body rod protein FlgC [Candidatus Saganbacteria bacterium CG08_land_8_20_14_0_20_45_16]